jgi:hypothetical protein
MNIYIFCFFIYFLLYYFIVNLFIKYYLIQIPQQKTLGGSFYPIIDISTLNNNQIIDISNYKIINKKNTNKNIFCLRKKDFGVSNFSEIINFIDIPNTNNFILSLINK